LGFFDAIAGRIGAVLLMLVGIGWLAKYTKAGAGLSELGRGAQEAISRLLSPKITPTFGVGWYGVVDMTSQSKDVTSDYSNPDSPGLMPVIRPIGIRRLP